MTTFYIGNNKIFSFGNLIRLFDEEYKIDTLTNKKQLFKYFYKKLKYLKNSEIKLDFIPKKYSYSDSFLLLVFASFSKNIYCKSNGEYLDITFSYNFPLSLEKRFLIEILNEFNTCVEEQLITLCPNKELIKANVSSNYQYDKFLEKKGRLMRKNNKLLKVNTSISLQNILKNWAIYCKKKFNVTISPKKLDLYEKIYALNGFHNLCYTFNNQIVCSGIYYVSQESKTLYFCIFSWNYNFYKFSPGKFVYSIIIKKCHELGLNFSFCYGLQKYKLDILSTFQ